MTPDRSLHLEPEQQELLKHLVEAWRNVPSSARQKFLVRHAVGDAHPTIHHNGILGGQFHAPLSDLQMLHRAGLVVFEHDGYGNGRLAPTPEAFQYYQDLQGGVGCQILNSE